MIAIRGSGSAIAERVRQLVPDDEEIMPVPRHAVEPPLDADRYLFCSGYMIGDRITAAGDRELATAMAVNFLAIARDCERILDANSHARICIVGSESGFSGSYDAAYAGAKAAIHNYIETRRIRPEQQLVGVAPSIIEDAGMTLRRHDFVNLEERRQSNPKRRFLSSLEVAAMIHFLLYVDRGYTTGVVIRMHGGDRR